MKTESVVTAVLGAVLKVILAIAVIFLIYKGTTICYDYGYRIFTEPAYAKGEGKVVTVSVTNDMSAYEIGKRFEEKGLVGDAKLFALQYMLSEYKKEVQPGVFDLSSAMTAEEMMAVMAGQEPTSDEEEN